MSGSHVVGSSGSSETSVLCRGLPSPQVRGQLVQRLNFDGGGRVGEGRARPLRLSQTDVRPTSLAPATSAESEHRGRFEEMGHDGSQAIGAQMLTAKPFASILKPGSVENRVARIELAR